MALHTVMIDAYLEPAKVSFPSIQSQATVEEHWLSKVEENLDITHNSKVNYKPLYTITNGEHTEISTNAVLQAFVSAYNQHHDIVLSPDDMWMIVCMHFADYVNSNAQQLRSLFVEHRQEKITLTVNDLYQEYDWNIFFDTMKMMIAENTKNDICQVLTADFSTTGKVESILSSACIMHAFKSYFNYDREVCICGIRQVHFMGTLNDWQSLRMKIQRLQSFSNWRFHDYINGVLPIFDEFIQTYQGNVNNQFWIKVCDITRDTNISYDSSGSRNLLTGWVLQLFGLKENQSRDLIDVKLPNIRVPLTLKNEITGELSECYILGGFHGVYSIENRHKPVMSLSVIKQIDQFMSKEEVSAKYATNFDD